MYQWREGGTSLLPSEHGLPNFYEHFPDEVKLSVKTQTTVGRSQYRHLMQCMSRLLP